MGFGEAIRTCFSKYVTFNGRASRSENWFMLFAVLVGLAGGLIFADTHTPIVSHIVTLVMFLPSTAVFVRRMHDIDRTGWWALRSVPTLGFIPPVLMSTMIPIGLFWFAWWLVWLVIMIVVLVWTCTRGTVGPNRYERNPLAGAIGTTTSARIAGGVST